MTFTSEDEPQESVSRATFSSMVQPYLVDGTAVFVMVRPFLKTGRRFVYKRYYRSKSKTKAVLQVNYGDGGTVVLWCENRHFILTTTVYTYIYIYGRQHQSLYHAHAAPAG